MRQEDVVIVCDHGLPVDPEQLAQYLVAVEVVIGQQPFERRAKNPPNTWFDEHLFDDFKGESLEDYVNHLQPEAIAQHKMIHWLAHPMEFGTEPSSITLWDHRIIYWPPADDEREMFLFKYEYAATEEEDTRRGVGLVGFTTFSFFAQDAPSPDGTPEDALAVHCMMELCWQDDPRGKDCSVKAGRKLLCL